MEEHAGDLHQETRTEKPPKQFQNHQDTQRGHRQGCVGDPWSRKGCMFDLVLLWNLSTPKVPLQTPKRTSHKLQQRQDVHRTQNF